jgi:ABC-2 type transport system ATP-binding protein
LRLRGRGQPRGQRWRWALRDVDFAIQPGEAVGLVGSNGSGKSTLLKILTRVMSPHSGDVRISGRVGALIEVRAGIHPELSGRENIFLYGSLLGLRRREIVRRFDEIVDFAELSQAIDRQVKFYSTGMQMRLGFAVAAFLEPDVLLVDEVLAVGDAAFQQRCLERMRQVIRAGTTLVLVSHDLASLEAMSVRGLWLDHGVLKGDGPARQVFESYRRAIEQYAEAGYYADGEVRLRKVAVGGPDGGPPKSFHPLQIDLDLATEIPCNGRLFLGVTEGAATPIFVTSYFLDLQTTLTLRCVIDDLPLPRGRYSAWVSFISRADRDLLPWHPVASFDVAGPTVEETPPAVVRLSPVLVRADWAIEH